MDVNWTSGYSHWRPPRRVVGPLIGVLAFVVNYCSMWVLLVIDGVEWSVADRFSEHHLKFTGHVLYNAQFVQTFRSSDTGDPSLQNHLVDSSYQIDITSTVPEIGYHAVPILILLVGGYILYQSEPPMVSGTAAAKIGVRIIPGYLILSISGIFLFDMGGGFASVRPDIPGAILVAGVVYPGVCGAVGALIGYTRDESVEQSSI